MFHTLTIIDGMDGGETRKIGDKKEIVEELNRIGFFLLPKLGCLVVGSVYVDLGLLFTDSIIIGCGWVSRLTMFVVVAMFPLLQRTGDQGQSAVTET